MKKVIIIEEENKKKNNLIEWLVYLICYTLVLITVSVLCESLYIDNAYFGLYALIATLIISVLNITIKPVLVVLTLPITTLTLGIFYPFINVIILKIVDFILGSHFEIKGFFMAFFIAILISIMNFLMESIIIKPILTRRNER
ncbi:MAG: phage holin family protein [Bacilli bacterium]|nr:phage holin family protein [Bacilli bacterium]